MSHRRIEHVATLKGKGNFIRSDSGESFPVDYQLDVFQDYLDYGHGREVPRRRDIRGSIYPPPIGFQLPSRQHTLQLQLADGGVVKCWVRNHSGEVVCQ
ncbi:MAG TPA: hypothetical protein VIW23_00380 [Candidatus Acidoferrum sp.]|jgi:hypothetical protein